MLNRLQIEAFVSEMERRWKARTPTTDPNYANPDYRVGRSEMVTWTRETFGITLSLADTADPDLDAAVKRLWRRLKRHYPEEWR